MSLIITGSYSKSERTRQILMRFDCWVGLVAVRTT